MNAEESHNEEVSVIEVNHDDYEETLEDDEEEEWEEEELEELEEEEGEVDEDGDVVVLN